MFKKLTAFLLRNFSPWFLGFMLAFIYLALVIRYWQVAI